MPPKMIVKKKKNPGPGPLPKGCGGPEPPSRPTALRNEECKKVISLPQLSGTCWANAFFMATLYSQYMRGLLINKMRAGMQSNEMTTELHALILDILERRFKSSKEMREYAYMYFQVITPETILKKLHEHDKKTFNFNPDARSGYFNFLYLPKFLKFLGVQDIALLDYTNNNLYHSVVNGGLEIQTAENNKYNKIKREHLIQKNAKQVYDAIIIYCNDLPSTRHIFEKNVTLGETYTYNGQTYVLDSLLLTNFNIDSCKKGHDISGLTCEGDRYMYNGWISNTRDPAMMGKTTGKALPCELMKYDWFNNKDDFCINPSLCKLDKTDSRMYTKDLCFNVSKGNRVYIYVNKAKCQYIPSQTPKTPEGDFTPLSPKIKRKPRIVSNKTAAHKECKEGKIINPLTNRCIDKDGPTARKLRAAKQIA